MSTMMPTLVTLYGDGTADLSGDEAESIREYLGGLDEGAQDIVARWNTLSPRERQAAMRAYPELLGIWPIIAKIAGAVVKGGAFIGKKIADEVKYQRKKKAKKAEQAQQAQAAAAAAVAAEAKKKADLKKKIIIGAAIGVPVVGLGAFLLMRKRG